MKDHVNWTWMARIGGSRTVMAAAVVISGLLLAATVVVRTTIHDASDLVVRGMGGMLIRSVNESISRWDARSGPHTIANRTILERLLRRHTDDGLRYLAIVDDEGRVIVEAGEPSLDELPDDLRSVLREGGRARLVRQVPPLRPSEEDSVTAGGASGAWSDARLISRPFGLPVSAYFVVFEFEPLAARDLEARGKTLVLAAVLACAGIIALAFLFAQALAARERLQSELEQKRRLATLGEMSAVLAHELRNPLASLKGHAQLLSEYLETDDQLAPKANRVVGDAIRLEHRMNDLLAFARTGDLEKTTSHPNAPLEAAIRAVGSDQIEVTWLATPGTSSELPNGASSHGNGVNGFGDGDDVEAMNGRDGGSGFDWTDGADRDAHPVRTSPVRTSATGGRKTVAPMWKFDPGRLQQALENVLLNAVQANPGDERVQASVAIENGKLRYRIRDFGKGIPENELDRIFDPFVTGRTRGVGLGLAVTRRIVELHGGKVHVRNAPEGGAEFTLEIPGDTD